MKKYIAEMLGTMTLVLMGCGAAVFAGAGQPFAAVGTLLVLIHIVCIPITGTSVNPARSIGPAIFEGVEALSQLWLFIVAPFLGATLAAFTWKIIDSE